MSISTSIVLNDGMSNVFKSAVNSLSAFSRALGTVKDTLGTSVNTSLVEESVKHMRTAMSQMSLLERQAQQTQKAFKWQNVDVNKVFQGTGTERLQRELQSMNRMSNVISHLQEDFAKETSKVNFLPKGAVNDIETANQRLKELQNNVKSFSNMDISILNQNDVSYMNKAAEEVRQMERELKNTQFSMKQNFQAGNLAGLNADLSTFNQRMQHAEMLTRDMNERVNQAKNFTWSGGGFQVFNTSGLERSKQEISAAKSLSEQLIQTQQKLTEKSANMKLITPNAVTDITNLNNRIANIGSTVNNLERQKSKLSRFDTTGVEQYNSRMERLRTQMTAIEQEQLRWNAATKANNPQQLNDSYNRLHSLVNEVESDIRDNTNAQNTFNNSLNNGVKNAGLLEKGFSNIYNRIIGIVGMYGGLYGAKMAISATDTYTNNNARLNLINDGLQTQAQLQQKIYGSALRSRSVYNDTVNVVAKLGLLAKDNFASTDEVIKFTELMNKTFKLSGASVQERTSAMYQLTQAMAAGKLQGDEFRSIMENAPLLAEKIAQYTGKTKDDLKEMSRDGVITADIIKKSLFGASAEIEEQFAKMPMTFADVAAQVKSTATMMFAPAMESFNSMFTNENVGNALTKFADIFGSVSMHLQLFGSHVSEILSRASPMIHQLGASFGSVGRYIISTNGLMGTLFSTARKLATNKNILRFGNTIAAGMMLAAKGVNYAVKAIGGLTETFGGFLPLLSSTVIGVTAFKATMSIALPITTSVGTAIAVMAGKMSIFETATMRATTAQLGLNAAMSANPYGLVATAIATVTSAVIGLVGAIQTLNKVSGLASEANIGGYSVEAWEYSEREKIPIQQAQLQYDTVKAAIDFNREQEEIIVEANKKIDTIIDNYENAVKGVNKEDLRKALLSKDNAITKTISEARESQAKNNHYTELNLDIINKNFENLSRTQEEIDKVMNNIDDITGNLGSLGGGNIPDVGKVGEVGKINSQVDISSEDLRYMKELAEREAINQFTQNTLAPQQFVSFGDVKETADINQIIGMLAKMLKNEIDVSMEGI